MDRKRPPPSPSKLTSSSSSSFIAYTTILPTFMFSISQIILHAIVPQVIVELVCLHESGSMDCDGSDVSGKASVINFLSATIISIPNVFVIGFYASFSRRYGLKPTLLTPVIGNFLFLLFVYLAKIWTSLYKPLIMLGSLISGLSGSRNTFMLATFAYAADVSEPQERSNVFSIIESAIYLARVICPLTIGMLSHRYGFGFTLLLGILVCFSNLCWICFVMRDPGAAVAPIPIVLADNNSRDGVSGGGEVVVSSTSSVSSTVMGSSGIANGDDDGMDNIDSDNNHLATSINSSNSSSSSLHLRDMDTVVLPVLPNPHLAAQLSIGAARPSEKLAWHPLETFRSVAKLFGKNRSIGNDTTPFIAFTYFVYHMVVVGVHTVEILFVKYVFKWGADSIGLFGSIHGLMEILSMLAMPIVVSKVLMLSLNDLNWIEVGLFSRALFFGLFGVVRTGSELFLILTLLVLCGPVVPRIKSYLSKSVDPRHSSDLFAALAGIDAISAFVSPLFTAVYFHTLTVYPGFVFELVALLFVFCAMIILSVRRGFGRDMMGVVMEYLPIPLREKSEKTEKTEKMYPIASVHSVPDLKDKDKG